MRVRLLSLDPADSKHPSNVLGVASVELTLPDGETLVINDYRIIKNSRPDPDYVVPPTRFKPGKTSTERVLPIVLLSRKTFHEIETAILDAYTKSRLAELDANSTDLGNSSADGVQ